MLQVSIFAKTDQRPLISYLSNLSPFVKSFYYVGRAARLWNGPSLGGTNGGMGPGLKKKMAFEPVVCLRES